MKISFDISGGDKVIRKLTNISTGIQDFTKPLNEIAKDWSKDFDANFPAAGSKLDAPWKPRLRLYSWPILQNTGKLRRGFGQKVQKLSAEIENVVGYAKYHQHGTAFLPVRKLVAVTQAMSKFALDKIKDYVNKFVRK